MARPTKYTKELANKICDIIASSNLGLSNICKDESLPSRSTVRDWIANNPEFSDLYARAKEDQADFLADEITLISDAELRTDVEVNGTNGSSTTNQDNVQRSRLMVESRKWLAMKLKPKKYGDRIDIDMNNKIINVNVPE
jgi:hypothetical protein